MHIDKQAQNFIVSGLMVVCVFAIWLSFAKFPDLIRSFSKDQAKVTKDIKKSNDAVQKDNQLFMPTQQQKPSLYQIKIGSVDIPVEVAETPAEKAQGLSGRESLPQSQGLLFLFDTPLQYQFWMKDMNFPIDIIWISTDKKIVDITENVDPGTYPKTFNPLSPAQYVLETNALFAQTHDIKIGDILDLSNIIR